MAIDAKTLAAAKKYTKETVEGAGAIKGKNCTIQSIIPMPTIHETEVTFAWYEDGASLPTLSKMIVPDGAQGPQGEQGETGLGIKSLNIDSNRHLIVTYDDDTTQDAGLIPGGGGPGEIDTELDPTSTNAVENRAIAIPIAALQASMLTKAEQTDISRIDLNISQLQGSLLNKVNKEAGKGLSTNDFSDTYKAKLEALLGIKSAGAGLNFDPVTGELTATGTSIEIDTELDPTSVHPVQNKAIAVPMAALQASMLTKANQSDISRIDLDIAKLQGSLLTKAEQTDINRIDLSISQLQGSLLTKASKSEVPTKVSDLTNDSDYQTASDVTAAISGKADKATTLSGYGITDAVNTSQIGSANGVAGLDSDGKVPAAQLPSYVDDVEEYATALSFPTIGESGKIYVALDTNKTYRWSGSNYVVVGGDLALGETSSTAYAGNKGKANADAISAIKNGTSIDSFSDVENALSGKQATISDLSTIRSGAAAGATAYQKPSTGIPKTDLASEVQKSLGKADTALQSHQSLANYYQTGDTAETDLQDGDYIPFYDASASAKRKTLWSNIKAVLKSYFDTIYSTFSGNYNDLSNKPTIPAAQVNSNWNATSGVAQILNKPTIPTITDTYSATSSNGMSGKAVASAISGKANSSSLATVATSGSYADLSNKPTIPAAVAVKGDSETTYRTGNVNLTKANIGLGNVGNFKAVSTVASQGLSDTEKSNARANIGAGTSSSDTKNTAGTTNSTSKLFLVGATSQAANPQTYSNANCYIQNGALYSNGLQVATDGWTETKTVQSDMTVTFTGLNDNYGYDLYCQNKLIGYSAMSKTGSGTSVTIKYTVTGAASGDVCKLRIIRN